MPSPRTLASEDRGVQIGRLANALTKPELAELLAIQWFALPFNGKRIRSASSALNMETEPLAICAAALKARMV